MAAPPVEIPEDAGQALVELFELLLQTKTAPLIQGFYDQGVIAENWLTQINIKLQLLNDKAVVTNQLLVEIRDLLTP